MPKKFLAAALALLAGAACALDINRADQAELETIKGIGPALSQRILDERARGAFADWADLVRRLPGIGPGNAARLSAGGLTVGGSAFGGRSGTAAAADGAASAAVRRP